MLIGDNKGGNMHVKFQTAPLPPTALLLKLFQEHDLADTWAAHPQQMWMSSGHS